MGSDELAALTERLRDRVNQHRQFAVYRVRVDYTDADAERDAAAAEVVERHARVVAALADAVLTAERLRDWTTLDVHSGGAVHTLARIVADAIGDATAEREDRSDG
jgi:MoxR-like ATPase